MNPRRLANKHDTAEIFGRAVRDRALAVISLQQGPDWNTFKSRFLERDAGRRFFVLDYVPEGGQVLPPLASGQYVGVSLRQSSRKLLFSTTVEAKGQFVFDSHTSIPAVRYRWPDLVTELQRRVYYRTPVPADAPQIEARVWRGGVAGRDPLAGTVSGKLVNISCGGAQVATKTGEPVDWTEEEVLGVELVLGDGRPPLLIDARFRGQRAQEQQDPSFALQFLGLELSDAGRASLQRIAYCVQKLHRMQVFNGDTPPPRDAADPGD